jgi:phage tail tape-measure protein
MKAIVLLSTVVLAVAMPAMADAAPAGGCGQLVQNINSLAGTIAGGASSYWAHRANFFELTFGELRQTVINWQQLAAQEKSQADPLKAAMPNTLASFKALIVAAQSQNCLPSAQLSAIAEPAIKLAKHVNFDQFPVENFEGSAD